MAKKAHVKATLKDANDVKAAWGAIPDFTIGPITLNEFKVVLEAADGLEKEYSTKDVELTGVKGKRDDKVRELTELITRFRSGVRSAYGPDSFQYEQAGGTRSSARKPPTRKTNVTAVNHAVATKA